MVEKQNELSNIKIEKVEKSNDQITSKPEPVEFRESSLESEKLNFGINHGSFDPEIPLIRNYDILIEPKSCHPDNYILFGIKSEAGHPERRTAVRKTWGDSSYYQVLIGFSGNRIFFILLY